MKKRIFTLFLLGCLASTCGWADNLAIERFDIPAGGTVDIDICMENPSQEYVALQFDVYLPDGVEVAVDEYGDYLYFLSTRLRNHDLIMDKHKDGFYRFMVYDLRNRAIRGATGSLMTLTLCAADTISTGEVTCYIRNQMLTIDSNTSNDIAETPFTCNRVVEAVVTSAGYGSFSWPRALDFTGTGVRAFVGTSFNNGYIHMEEVQKVPANTGVILKGGAGTYNPVTTDGETDDVSMNKFLSTAAGALMVDADGIYALGKKNDVVGMYMVNTGVEIPQYKAYLSVDDLNAPSGFVFEETTAIGAIEAENSKDDVYYDVAGRMLTGKPVQKGIYLNKGRKVVIR